MAKFELSIYDTKTGEVEKTYQRNFMPVSLFIKFQKFSEEVTGNKVESDEAFYKKLKNLFVEMFPELTEAEYSNKTDAAEVIALFNTVLKKSTTLEDSSKNV